MAELTIDASEITAALQRNVEDYTPAVGTEQIGRIVEVGDGIARVSGLPGAAVNELLEFEDGTLGLALNLDEDTIGAVVLGEVDNLEEEQTVKATGRIQTVPVGDALLGRVVNALGEPIDGKGPINTTETRRMEVQAPGIVGRQPVSEPMQTGIKAIDAMTPIGRGQRELIIGDRKTGKTTVAVDTIINQAGQGVKCIYVAIGQKNSSVAQTVATLEAHQALEYTVVVVASAGDPAPYKYLASTGWRTVSTRSSSMTTCPSRPRPTVRSRCSCAARRGARPTRATFSTCTRACSSGPPSSPMPSAPDRSPPCRSLRPRPATFRPTSRPT
jgi:F-type H+-transporting ATPase subunit alpha